MRLLLACALALSLGCKREAAAPKPPPSPADARDQYALVKEVIAAREGNADPGQVRRTWLAKRYTWEVSILEPLCRSPAQCWAVPFDYAKFTEPVVQGWLPHLALDPTAHQKLIAECKAFKACIVRFEGTLTKFDLDPGLPTSVGFEDVRVLGAREAGPDERWGRRNTKALEPKSAPGPR